MLNIFLFQVKQIMEEAVTRKFVHEESSSITSLCGKCQGQGSHRNHDFSMINNVISMTF